MKKSVIVTGASVGIGRAAALAFAARGYNLAICCRFSEKELEETKKMVLDYNVSCLTYIGDMGIYEDARHFIRLALDTYSDIDCLINNAGISHIGLLSDMTPREWENVIRTNLTSVYNCCHEVIPSMVSRKSGRIINISSVWGNVGASCEAAYSASKGGVNSLTKALAKELAPSHITVNAIACGMIDTRMNQCFSEEERQELIEEIPACRMGTPEEVGETALTLCEGPEYLTGQIITLDGGWR